MCQMLFIYHTTCGHRGFTRTPLTPTCGYSCTLLLKHLDVPHHCPECSSIPAAPGVAGMIPYMRAPEPRPQRRLQNAEKKKEDEKKKKLKEEEEKEREKEGEGGASEEGGVDWKERFATVLRGVVGEVGALVVVEMLNRRE
ncbi:uncharacterized protein LAJ45_11261 [Morchella importuna]|uniref:Uncharacterized protein n=1 Tax=Morchella conica CCBAS932 TaxID=1392247 RepID=A0A3N4KV65_9PEZI|nr:uncharacterized protein LAJ45_11261 [Morchella importuna]KAH8144760.1 hypothetical protein LAJ45_11261 [Morchella importuna]RPB14427.1 hypothetical protein P167DRAFT_572572 [Morchella conica CCBAS932]